MNIQIYPLDKVVFDDVSICFGMEKSAVELSLGAGEVIGNRCMPVTESIMYTLFRYCEGCMESFALFIACLTFIYFVVYYN